jgi:hypothetical protein
MSCRSWVTADAGAAAAEAAFRGGDGDDAEGGEAVVEGDFRCRLALGIQGQAGLPEQQGVEQFPRGQLAAAAAGGQGLLAEVALAGDLHLGGEGLQAVAPLGHHGFQQVPACVGGQFQQALVHGGQGDFRAGRRRRAFGGAHLDRDPGLFADGVAGPVGLHLHIQAMAALADLDAGDAQLEGGPAQVDQGGGLDRVVAAAHGQGGDEDVGRPVGLHRQLDHRGLAGQFHHLGVEDAFPFHGDQHAGFPERHAHLEAGGLAGLVAFLLGDQVDAVVVVLAEPPFVLAGHPEAVAGAGLARPSLSPSATDSTSTSPPCSALAAQVNWPLASVLPAHLPASGMSRVSLGSRRSRPPGGPGGPGSGAG